MSKSEDLKNTLKERGKTYGEFAEYARIKDELSSIVTAKSNWLNCVHKAGLDMIMSKVARILNGDPDHADSWHDIAGYATLVEEDINKRL